MCCQFLCPQLLAPGPPAAPRTEGGQLGTPRRKAGAGAGCWLPPTSCKRCVVRRGCPTGGGGARVRGGQLLLSRAVPGRGYADTPPLSVPRWESPEIRRCTCRGPCPETSRLSRNPTRPGPQPGPAAGAREQREAGRGGGGATRARPGPSQGRSERGDRGRGGGIRSAVYIPRGAGSHFGSGAGSLAGAAPLLAVGRRQRHSAERTPHLSSSSSSSRRGGTPAVSASALVQPPSLSLLFLPSLAPW